METLAFVYGIVSAVLLFAVGGIVWAIKQIHNIKHELNSIYSQIDEVNRNTDFRVDREAEMTHRELRELDADLRAEIDSRIDKLLNKVQSDKKQLLND